MSSPPPPPYRSLFMRRPHLRDLPPVSLPIGFRLRTAESDDAPGVSAILTAAFAEEWDLDRVRRTLLEDTSVVAVHVIERADGRLVATASSRLVPEQYPGSGYLHWVGADPEARGHRLGYLVTLAVLHDFAARQLADSVLETDDWRLPAIATYLKCGYVPELREAAHHDRWQKVKESLRPGTLHWPGG
jgi:mycothiol synthase